jgi:hypothetical protein
MPQVLTRKLKATLFSLLLISGYLAFSSCNGGRQKEESKMEERPALSESKHPVIGSPKILFIGNSHTEYYVSLPQMFNDLCAYNKKEMSVDTLVEMGTPLSIFLTDENNRLESKITKTDNDSNYYDYVVLQEETPVAIDDPDTYDNSVKELMEKIKKNSPDAEFLIYEIMSPIGCKEKMDSYDFTDFYNKIKENTEGVASNNKARIFHLGSAIKDAYSGVEDYKYNVNGQDRLRHGVQNLHMLNDAGFMASALLYATLFNERPAIPEKMTLSTGTGENDGWKMQPVKTAVSNPSALLNIAMKNK